MTTAHVDTFARDNLPPADQQPEFLFDLPALRFPEHLNCATELLDKHVAAGRGDRLSEHRLGQHARMLWRESLYASGISRDH